MASTATRAARAVASARVRDGIPPTQPDRQGPLRPTAAAAGHRVTFSSQGVARNKLVKFTNAHEPDPATRPDLRRRAPGGRPAAEPVARAADPAPPRADEPRPAGARGGRHQGDDVRPRRRAHRRGPRRSTSAPPSRTAPASAATLVDLDRGRLLTLAVDLSVPARLQAAVLDITGEVVLREERAAAVDAAQGRGVDPAVVLELVRATLAAPPTPCSASASARRASSTATAPCAPPPTSAGPTSPCAASSPRRRACPCCVDERLGCRDPGRAERLPRQRGHGPRPRRPRCRLRHRHRRPPGRGGPPRRRGDRARHRRHRRRRGLPLRQARLPRDLAVAPAAARRARHPRRPRGRRGRRRAPRRRPRPARRRPRPLRGRPRRARGAPRPGRPRSSSGRSPSASSRTPSTR